MASDEYQHAFITIPTYNEADNLESLTREILRVCPGIKVIIIDDNSADGTGQIADRLAVETTQVQVIHRPGKLGYASAHRAGFERAIQQEAELIIQMDADFSHHPKYLPAILEQAKEHDVVVGSRYVPGGGVENWGKHRQWLSRTANRWVNRKLKISVNDCTSGFRCYHQQVLKKLLQSDIRSEGYGFQIESMFRLVQQKRQIAEVPIVFTDRTHGKSKLSKRIIIEAFSLVRRLARDQSKTG